MTALNNLISVHQRYSSPREFLLLKTVPGNKAFYIRFALQKRGCHDKADTLVDHIRTMLKGTSARSPRGGTCFGWQIQASLPCPQLHAEQGFIRKYFHSQLREEDEPLGESHSESCWCFPMHSHALRVPAEEENPH